MRKEGIQAPRDARAAVREGQQSGEEGGKIDTNAITNFEPRWMKEFVRVPVTREFNLAQFLTGTGNFCKKQNEIKPAVLRQENLLQTWRRRVRRQS